MPAGCLPALGWVWVASRGVGNAHALLRRGRHEGRGRRWPLRSCVKRLASPLRLLPKPACLPPPQADVTAVGCCGAGGGWREAPWAEAEAPEASPRLQITPSAQASQSSGSWQGGRRRRPALRTRRALRRRQPTGRSPRVHVMWMMMATRHGGHVAQSPWLPFGCVPRPASWSCMRMRGPPATPFPAVGCVRIKQLELPGPAWSSGGAHEQKARELNREQPCGQAAPPTALGHG